MTMVIAPLKKKTQAKSDQRRKREAERAAREENAEAGSPAPGERE